MSDERAVKERRERRMKPGALNATRQRLEVDESTLDRDKFEYRWANDQEARVQRLHGQDWDPVDEVKKDKLAGTDQQGKPFSAVLMKKHKDWYDGDQKAKQKPLDDMEQSIREGANHQQDEPSLTSGNSYTPGGGNVIDGRNR